MMIKGLLVFCLLFFCHTAGAADGKINLHGFAQLPVQNEGRLEPIDSFARTYSKQLAIAADSTATEWLAELLFNPDNAYEKPMFKIAQSAVWETLSLTETEGHHYSFRTIIGAMNAHSDIVRGLLQSDPKNITDPTQLSILSLYQSTLIYFELSRSLSLVQPDFKISNPALAQKMGVPSDQSFSYLDLMQHKAKYLDLARLQLKKMDHKAPTADQTELLKIGYQMQQMEPDKRSQILRIVPSPWVKELWLSPWMMLQQGQGSPQTAALLNSWQAMAAAYRAGDQVAFDQAVQNNLEQTRSVSGKIVRLGALKIEYCYNLMHLFALSGLFYVLSLIALAIKRYKKNSLRFLPVLTLVSGFLLHSAGLTARIYILERPPVGTLYESIVFVGWVTVVGALIMERRNRNGVGILIGALAGLVLHVLAPFFAQSGDTMAPLVAVLNTNFWLATHVLAITAGYGCCLVTSLLAHFYLWQRIKVPHDREANNSLLRATIAAMLIALCFTAIGTVLGGIWADQSWGRFWGWDPKENGALLIVLWLLFVLHGRLSGLLRADHFALFSAATIIVVALSWFGVNLLNVGLHSYGFTSGIALYLGLFVVIELSILAVCKYWLYQKHDISA